jgi:hypothetical protein
MERIRLAESKCRKSRSFDCAAQKRAAPLRMTKLRRVKKSYEELTELGLISGWLCVHDGGRARCGIPTNDIAALGRILPFLSSICAFHISVN